MNVLLLESAEVSDAGRATLTGRRAEHVAKVLKKAPGSTIGVGMLGGNLGSAVVETCTPRSLVLSACTFDRAPPPKRPISVVLALPRPPVLRRVLQHLTAMGVERIILLHAKRVEKSYWMSPALEPASIDDNLRLGLEQAVDTVAPCVEQVRGFKAFVQSRLPALAAGARCFVAHPGGEALCPTDVDTPVVVCVGPEGGFIPYEIEQLEAAGVTRVSLGPRILRVETAAVAVVGRLGR